VSGEHLVLQGAALDPQDVDALVVMTGASDAIRLSPTAVRLLQAARHHGVASYCAQAALDFGYVAATARLADFKLVAMDMDSTLITIECVDEIAALAGIKPQVAAITAAAMRGEIEFRESLQRRVALLAGLPETALASVYDERLQLSPGAETLLARVQELGIKTLLVSGGFTFFTERLRERLRLDYVLANVLEVQNGHLTGRLVGTIVDAEGKAAEVRRVRELLKIERAQVMVLGDGANDLAMMAEGGVSIAYHAKPVVRERATYSLNHVGLEGVLNLFQ
jgi:phosphoserine phosphatase